MTTAFEQIDAWIDAHFEEQVRFLQQLVQVPTDTPPGNNAPHADRTAALLAAVGFDAERHAVPEGDVRAAGMQSVTNLIVRRQYGDGLTIALNAHGDVVPPGDGWTHDPYGGDVHDGRLYGRAAAVSKSDFSTFTFAVRALESLGLSLAGAVELHFTYDEEFGGELGPGWLLRQGLTKPDLLIAAGFSYQVVTAHNGCLQLEVTVNGRPAHAAIPDTGIDALQAAVAMLQALYAENAAYRQITSAVPGITHPYLNVGRIEGGTNTNVVPGTVVFKLDRRMIPEEVPSDVEASVRAVIARAAAKCPGVTVEVRRLLLANPLKPLPRNRPLVDALQRHGSEVFGEAIPESGTPLYADARLYGEHGIPAVIYGAGPRTLLESNAKRADEHVVLDDLRRATQVVARVLLELLRPPVSAATCVLYDEATLRKLAEWEPIGPHNDEVASAAANSLVRRIGPDTGVRAFVRMPDYDNFTTVYVYRPANVTRSTSADGHVTTDHGAVVLYFSHAAPVIALGTGSWSETRDQHGAISSGGYSGLDLPELLSEDQLPDGPMKAQLTRAIAASGFAVASPEALRAPAPAWFRPLQRSNGMEPWDRIYHLLFQYCD